MAIAEVEPVEGETVDGYHAGGMDAGEGGQEPGAIPAGHVQAPLTRHSTWRHDGAHLARRGQRLEQLAVPGDVTTVMGQEVSRRSGGDPCRCPGLRPDEPDGRRSPLLDLSLVLGPELHHAIRAGSGSAPQGPHRSPRRARRTSTAALLYDGWRE